MRDKINNWKYCKSIAIMGGTFDPIHFGHLVTAEAVRHQFLIERVIFIPTGHPPHKKNLEITHSEHRYLMTVLATVTNNFFDVSRIEIDRSGFTYTIDTVKELRNICGSDTKIYFITGADAVFQILAWKDADTLLSICEFVAVSRPGYEKERLFNEIEKLKNNYESKIHFMEVPALSISSSDIRDRVKGSMPIKYLLPRAVEDYIHKFNIYSEVSSKEQNVYDEIAITQQLKTTLSAERFTHTIGVCNEAEKLAQNYGCDIKKARIAALLHDCAKDIPDDMKKILCKEYQIKLDDVTKKQKELIHCVLGKEIAKRNYGVDDEDILNAIRYHTTGRPNMSLLEKIIYLADYFEPNRQDFEGLKRIKKLAYKDLNEAMKFALTLTINHIKHKKKELHPFTQQALDFYTNPKNKLKYIE